MEAGAAAAVAVTVPAADVMVAVCCAARAMPPEPARRAAVPRVAMVILVICFMGPGSPRSR